MKRRLIALSTVAFVVMSMVMGISAPRTSAASAHGHSPTPYSYGCGWNFLSSSSAYSTHVSVLVQVDILSYGNSYCGQLETRTCFTPHDTTITGMEVTNEIQFSDGTDYYQANGYSVAYGTMPPPGHTACNPWHGPWGASSGGYAAWGNVYQGTAPLLVHALTNGPVP